MEVWLSIGVGIVGIISTIVAWRFNPKRLLYAELDAISKKLEALNVIRDEALAKNDSDKLTIILADINKLHARQTILFQRVK